MDWKKEIFYLALSSSAFFLMDRFGSKWLRLREHTSNETTISNIAVNSTSNVKSKARWKLLLSILSACFGLVTIFQVNKKKREYNLLNQSPQILVANALQLPWIVRGTLSGTVGSINAQSPFISPISQQTCAGYLVLVKELIQETVFVPNTTTDSEGKEITKWETEVRERESIVFKDFNLRKFILSDITGSATIKVKPQDNIPMQVTFDSHLLPNNVSAIFNQLNFSYTPNTNAVSFHIQESILAINSQMSVCGDVITNSNLKKVKMASTPNTELLFFTQTPDLEIGSRKLAMWKWILFCGGSWTASLLLFFDYFFRE